MVHELEESHQTHLDTSLDEIIGLTLFPKYLECKWIIIQVFLNSVSSSYS